MLVFSGDGCSCSHIRTRSLPATASAAAAAAIVDVCSLLINVTLHFRTVEGRRFHRSCGRLPQRVKVLEVCSLRSCEFIRDPRLAHLRHSRDSKAAGGNEI